MKKFITAIIAASLLLVGSPATAQDPGRGREVIGKYIVLDVDTDNCYRTGRAHHCPVSDVHHIVEWEIQTVTIMRSPLWESGPYAKGAFIDYGQGPVVQLQGYQGWTPAGAPPIVLNAPDWGYTVDVSTGAWTSPDGSTGGLL